VGQPPLALVPSHRIYEFLHERRNKRVLISGCTIFNLYIHGLALNKSFSDFKHDAKRSFWLQMWHRTKVTGILFPSITHVAWTDLFSFIVLHSKSCSLVMLNAK
jgi:hypothetical protein